MNASNSRGVVHRDWLRPMRQTVLGLTDESTRLAERACADPRPDSRAAALATPWTFPPEPHDAEEAGQQLCDYFDAVAAMECRLEALHSRD